MKKGIDPEDIFQDVRLKIWSLVKAEKNIYNYSSYIKKIVDTSVIDYLRKNRREDNVIFLEKKILLAEQKKNRLKFNSKNNYSGKIVHEKIDLLLESRKKVIKLFFLGLTIKEISICLKWSEHKTRNLLYRGLNDLKELIKRTEKNDV